MPLFRRYIAPFRRAVAVPLVASLSLVLPVPPLANGLVASINNLVAPTVTQVTPGNGNARGGTRVTISGTGFVGMANACAFSRAVYFGADPQYDQPILASSFQVVSDTEIIAIAPPNYGGRVDVQVHTLCGTSRPSPNSDSFSYVYDGDGQCLVGSCALGVDGGTIEGPLGHVGNGFNGGYNSDAGHNPPSSVPPLMKALQPESWRLGGGLGPNGTFDLARASGAKVSVLLETDWLNSGGSPLPWLEPPVFAAFVRKDVQTREQNGTAPDYWDVWNEPDDTGTVNQYLGLYQTAYEAIKGVDPNGKVVGPSIGYFLTTPAGGGNAPGSNLDLQTFASFATQHNLKFAAISYHDEAEYAPPGVIGVLPDNYTPSALGAHVLELRSLLSGYPGLGSPKIFVNEYGPGRPIQIPGWLVGSLSSLESAGADEADMTCASADDCSHRMDGLMTDDGTPQMPYWVLTSYARMSGERVATSSSGTNLTALASRDDTTNQIRVLAGRHDECGGPPRPSPGAGLPNTTCPSFQPPIDPPVSSSLTVHEPYSAAQVQVTVTLLPNSAMGPDGFNPVPSQPAPVVSTVQVVGGTVSIPLGHLADGDAVDVTIAPTP